MSYYKTLPKTFKKDHGVYYTPLFLADFVARLTTDAIRSSKIQNKKILSVVDPACGDARLLNSINQHLKKCKDIILDKITGFDIDQVVVSNNTENITNVNFECRDGLDSNDKFDIYISNPPWGSQIDEVAKCVYKSDFKLAKQQYDICELFIESAFNNLSAGGIATFILPDSIFNSEKKYIRKYILENFEIFSIVRLGEKIFKDVNRACFVLVCIKPVDNLICLDNKVKCFRLDNRMRKEVLNGYSQLYSEYKKAVNILPQSSFYENANMNFSVDLLSSDKLIFDKLLRSSTKFRNYCFGSRGVELSKKGFIAKCILCNSHQPLPTKQDYTCASCGEQMKLNARNVFSIVSKFKYKKIVKPFVSGVNIGRYQVKSTFFIETGVKGINYKSESIYSGTKIMVRKTGVGITAALDYDGVLSNQVVYIFKTNESLFQENVTPEVLIAILNSRVVSYFYLKSKGDIEWKSHAYITQKEILNLPTPNLSKQDAKCMLQELTSLVKKLNQTEGDKKFRDLDAKIEKIVGTLFGLNFEDYLIIYRELGKFQMLKPIQRLLDLPVNKIFQSGI